MLDSNISEAISDAAQEQGQPPGLAEKLVRWMDDLVRHVDTLDDRDAVDRRLGLLYETAVVERTDDPSREGESDPE